MTWRNSLIVSCIALASANTALAQLPSEVVGSAYSKETGDLLYIERHRYLEDHTHEVRYFSPQGEMFARKQLSYDVSENAPAFEQLNELKGEWIKASYNDDQLELQYRETENGKVSSKSFDLKPNLLVDAGFDRYVKNNWQSLVSDRVGSIEYLVPSKLTTVGFDVSKVACLPDTQESAVCFTISPQSWWVSLVVDPIIVAYDQSTRNLLRFTGRGNIANADGKYQSVDIRYKYPDQISAN